MKKIKYFIIGIIILLIILIASLFLISNKKNISSNATEDNGKSEPPAFSEEVGYREFLTISNCVSNYLDRTNVKNPVYYSISNGKMEQAVSNNEIKEIIKSLLSKNYKGNISGSKEKYIFTPINATKLFDGNVQSYAIYGIVTNTDIEYKKDMYFIVNIDTSNHAFSIEPIDGENIELKDVKAEKLDKIEVNDYNEFIYAKVDQQIKATQYFNTIKRLMLAKPELAYEYLDEEYKEERFGDYDYFKKYVENNKKVIAENSIKSYKVSNDEKQIVVGDQNSVNYEFNIDENMQYKVKIDNYIVMFDEEVKKYDELDNTKKNAYCIKRWINMINSKDYKFAYNLLDETFREKNFGSVEKFEEYAKKSWPEHMKLVFDKYEELDQYVSLSVNIYDRDSNDGKIVKNQTFIIKLLENPSFVLSFSMDN